MLPKSSKNARTLIRSCLCGTKLEDEIFTEEGQNTLFNLLKSSQKRIVKYQGGHTDPKGAQLKEAVEFLQTYLVF